MAAFGDNNGIMGSQQRGMVLSEPPPIFYLNHIRIKRILCHYNFSIHRIENRKKRCSLGRLTGSFWVVSPLHRYLIFRLKFKGSQNEFMQRNLECAMQLRKKDSAGVKFDSDTKTQALELF